MPLAIGTRVGGHEILSLIGHGGMGEVYRARDSRLDRDVALKILPEAFAEDADRIARFRREAKTLAALNHPNIGAIHGIEEVNGVTALVMELVDGDDLSQRIARRPLPLDEALPIARQIADALEAAHSQGIVHRDLKPANIKVRADGRVKVLDFGLAKILDSMDGKRLVDIGESPTITSPAMTEAGLILGTASYMSPEQARGKTVDKRTDIWAFGCVLYEMLTGRRAFAGDDVSDVLASVLAREVDFTALPAGTPSSIRRLLRRCLQKDRHHRLADIGDARLDIADASAKSDLAAPDRVESRGLSRERVFWTAALVAVAGVATWFALRPAATIPPEMRFDLATSSAASPYSPAISPNGKTIAFVASSDGQSRLWLQSLDSGVSRAIAGTEGAMGSPFWSPDGGSIGFFANDRLYCVDADGGSVRQIANARRPTGGTWNQDGVILFGTLGNPLARVSASGGDAVPVTGLAQQGSDFQPQFLPDGRHFIYYVRGNTDVRGVYVGQLGESMPPRRVLDADTTVSYVPTGHLLFGRQGTLLAQRFDPSTFQLSGSPFVVAEGLRLTGELGLSASQAGSIVYRAGTEAAQRQFVWFNRSGNELSRVGDVVRTSLSQPMLSPDGQSVAFYRTVNGNVDVWTLDLRRNAFSRVTTDPADDVVPVWSPDGRRLIFSSNRKSYQAIYMKALDGGSDELVFGRDDSIVAADWSSDGRYLLFDSRSPRTSADIWALSLDDKKAFPLVNNAFDSQYPQFAPNGKWFAYQSDESGRPEIYVQTFPEPGNAWVVSTNGGSQVRWSRDGNELFYVDREGKLTAVSIRLPAGSGAPELGRPVTLFAPPLGNAVQEGDFRPQYVVSSDGQRFLVATVSTPPSTPISVILNWKPKG